ncbi:hypothetical protein HPG69_019502 [Diceros bicornis minor]|uniref:Uncharacterized protein n=1 Tax=Diceros bicornis minor TaxID=77932 RepID=A0A7J7F7L3_DICBM|nr:hypothetical protein HPG69_019502 [Diceros bicornis minor]
MVLKSKRTKGDQEDPAVSKHGLPSSPCALDGCEPGFQPPGVGLYVLAYALARFVLAVAKSWKTRAWVGHLFEPLTPINYLEDILDSAQCNHRKRRLFTMSRVGAMPPAHSIIERGQPSDRRGGFTRIVRSIWPSNFQQFGDSFTLIPLLDTVVGGGGSDY